MQYIKHFTILSAIYEVHMPQTDRHRERIVPIEFNNNERFDDIPYKERVTIVLVTNGKACMKINSEVTTLSSPCVLCFSYKDEFTLISQTKFSAKSFSFNLMFLNSRLTFKTLEDNAFTELEDEHDRNMLSLFLLRNANYNGMLDLPAKTYVRLNEWLGIIGTETYAQSDGYWTCRIRRYLLQSLYLIDDIYMAKLNNESNDENIKKSIADIVLEYIHTNYQNEILLDDLCVYIHTNRTSLNKNFKAQTGKTAMDYLLHYRLKIACEALTHTNLTLNEIAGACGFKYDTYFIKQFTNRKEISPTQYRMSAWEEKK